MLVVQGECEWHIFNNCLPSAESSCTFNIVKLCDCDPNGLGPGPCGVLEARHHAGGGAVAGAVVKVGDLVWFDFLSA